MKAEVGIVNGRWCLRVAGIVVVVEGQDRADADPVAAYYRESTSYWHRDSLIAAAEEINGKERK